MRKNKYLKDKVEVILRKIPHTRDSDIRLMIEIWLMYYPSMIHETASKNKVVFLKDIIDLPREDDIKRYRAMIQNGEKKYLPTSWKVAKQRRIKEELWKDYARSLTEHTRI